MFMFICHENKSAQAARELVYFIVKVLRGQVLPETFVERYAGL